MAEALTYASYLQLPQLMMLQHVQSDPEEHDELLFIIIHQTYELWFRQILHELDSLKANLRNNKLYACIHTLKRLRTIMKTLVSQLDILETMTPMSFGSFRDRLDTSSGFQSTQFREVEFVLGYKRPQVVRFLKEDDVAYPKVMQRLQEPSVMDAMYVFLSHYDQPIPEELLSPPEWTATQPNEAVQDALHDLYINRPDVAILLELFTDFDEGLQEWRYRHVKMVERTIGDKPGTGGSPGVEFLKKSLFNPVFPDLWAIRHRL